MGSYREDQAQPFGAGLRSPEGSVEDLKLLGRLRSYRHRINKSFQTLSPEELSPFSPSGRLWAAAESGGTPCFLLFEEGKAWLSDSQGHVIHGELPLLKEARQLLRSSRDLQIIAGDLLLKGSGPEGRDLFRAEPAADWGDHLSFIASEIFEGLGPFESYEANQEELKRLFKGAWRLHPLSFRSIEGSAAIRQLYMEWVEGAEAEGLLIRPESGKRGLRLRPSLNLNAVIVGYTESAKEPNSIHSLCLALRRGEGQYQIIGECKRMTEERREALFYRLKERQIPSSFHHPNRKGALYRFVRPELALKIRLRDLRSEAASGEALMGMVCSCDGASWSALQLMPGISCLRPTFVRLLEREELESEELSLDQVRPHCPLPKLEAQAQILQLPQSQLLRREVYIKRSKEKSLVRKVLLWKSNKERVDPRFPAFLVQFTDYNPGRKEPLKRELRLAPRRALADEIFEAMLESHIKRGWSAYPGE